MSKKGIIVCVDDEQIILNALQKQITRRFGDDFIYEFCESAEEALEVIDEVITYRSELLMVISDQIMPGLKGDEFLIQIHENYPNSVNILLTGQAGVESGINAINNANLFRYHTKPWNESDLLNSIEKGLMQYQLKKDKDILLGEVHHRVKNNLAIISGILQLQILNCDNSEVNLNLTESMQRIETISNVHELLYNHVDVSSADLGEYVNKMINGLKQSFLVDDESITFDIDIQDLEMNINQLIPIGLLLNELITNSFKHAFGNKKGTISIRMKRIGQMVRIKYRDDGIGIEKEVLEGANDSLGMSLMDFQLQQLNADYKYLNGVGFGLEFNFKIKN